MISFVSMGRSTLVSSRRGNQFISKIALILHGQPEVNQFCLFPFYNEIFNNLKGELVLD